MTTLPSKDKLDSYVKLGLIRSQTHPELPLTIYGYTETTTYERLWNNVTMSARGLVYDAKGRCVVRCMPKFFNDNEPHALCDIPKGVAPVYYDKLDGSLIQIVNDPEYGLVITSKGSFASDHVGWAKQILYDKFGLFTRERFIEGLTYVFELIHPSNRIVLNYGTTTDLYLLAVIETRSGRELNINEARFSHFELVREIEDIAYHMDKQNVEGMVVKTGSHRYKVKTGEYLRLHRIVTETSSTTVWEVLAVQALHELSPESNAKQLHDAIREMDARQVPKLLEAGEASFSQMLANVPDEFYDWVEATAAAIRAEVSTIIAEAEAVAASANDKRHAIELCGVNLTLRALVLAKMDGKLLALHGLAWRNAKPAYSKAFMSSETE